jgi:hypothetical protein
MVLKVLRRLKAEEGHLKNDSISNNSEKHGWRGHLLKLN